MSLNFQAGSANRYPLPELLKITLTKPVDEMTPFEHLMLGEIIEQDARYKRQDPTNKGE